MITLIIKSNTRIEHSILESSVKIKFTESSENDYIELLYQIEFDTSGDDYAFFQPVVITAIDSMS